MSKNAAIVGLGDKFVNSYPLNQIENQGVKDLIKNALNQALGCRVSINTTRKLCDQGQVAYTSLEHSPRNSLIVSSGGWAPKEGPCQESPEAVLKEIAFPLQKFERPAQGEMGYVFHPAISLAGGRSCCKIINIAAAPLPLARLSATVDISTAFGLNGASISFDARARAELVGLDATNQCDLQCGNDTLSGSVELVLDGTIRATVAIGPFGAGIGFALEGLRVPMGEFLLTCGQDVTLS